MHLRKKNWIASLCSQRRVDDAYHDRLREPTKWAWRSRNSSSSTNSSPLMWWLFVSLSLAGCGAITSERVRCPKTSILAEFSKSFDSQDGILIRSDLDSVISECSGGGNQTFVDLRLRVTSFRPLPNFHNAMTIKPSYFVAVVDNTGNVLSRSNHDLEVAFEEKQTTKVSFVRLEEKVPVNKEVTIYIGFNLDESQVKFLLKERNKHITCD